MATINQSVILKTDFTLHHDRTDDTIGLGKIDAGTGQQNYPKIDLSADTVGLVSDGATSDTLGICNCQGSGTFSLTTGTTVTLVDLATAEDRLGVAFSGCLVKYFGIVVNTPNGTKAVRVGAHGVAGAIALGMGGTTPYMSIEHSQVFHAPYSGWAGTAIALANNSGVTVTGSFAFAGKR